MKKSSYASRLREAITDSQTSVRDFADALGMSTQAVYKVLRGQTKSLHAAHHVKAAKILHVDSTWLADGVGTKHLRGPVALNNNPEYPSVPIVSISFSTGEQGYKVEHVQSQKTIVFRADWFASRGYQPGRLVAITVVGNSMEPTLYDGDLAIINLDQQEPAEGEVFALRVDDQLVLRRLFKASGQWWLTPDNVDRARHPRREYDSGCLTIGRIVYRQSERV